MIRSGRLRVFPSHPDSGACRPPRGRGEAPIKNSTYLSGDIGGRAGDNGASPDLEARKRGILSDLGARRGLVVALSGGVDSGVLLALAVEALGVDRVVAVTGRSASLHPDDLTDARRVAGHLGVRHVVLDTGELALPAYRANRGDRCFHCRDELFRVVEKFKELECPAFDIAYGAIADDLGDVRPGMRAADRHGVLAPLLTERLTKAEVRTLARRAGLEVRDKPASACLASRIPLGRPVTSRRLDQVGRAEAALRRMGFGQLRVRHHDEVARIETDADGERRMADPATRAAVVRAVQAAGFRFVALDLEGYRTGSLNPVRRSPSGTGPNRAGGQ